MPDKEKYQSLSRGFSCEVCDKGHAHHEVSHDNGETWVKVCDECYPKEMREQSKSNAANDRIYGSEEM